MTPPEQVLLAILMLGALAGLVVVSYTLGTNAEIQRVGRRKKTASDELEEELRRMLSHKATSPWYSVAEDGSPMCTGWYVVAHEARPGSEPGYSVVRFDYDQASGAVRAPGIVQVTHWASVYPPEVAKRMRAAAVMR
jgi:hypothetical protein